MAEDKKKQVDTTANVLRGFLQGVGIALKESKNSRVDLIALCRSINVEYFITCEGATKALAFITHSQLSLIEGLGKDETVSDEIIEKTAEAVAALIMSI